MVNLAAVLSYLSSQPQGARRPRANCQRRMKMALQGVIFSQLQIVLVNLIFLVDLTFLVDLDRQPTASWNVVIELLPPLIARRSLASPLVCRDG
ncbi:hypothetical protein BDV98DRAFT_348404 [Pterulicium gracile]|uniref:Uncharacterized protein n=1 Tax=Pterulicium gracile TaxID=1884261 RepID=A0A5C3QSI6_9AGAR|nr:hypothetical protein BDV98DRAFT_348404 [Pterula gracilis]